MGTGEEEDFDFASAIIPDADSMLVDSECGSRQLRSTHIFRLPQKWALYFDSPKSVQGGAKGRGKEYGSNLEKVTEFASIQEFWRCWNHIQEPKVMSMLTVFKIGAKPTWEDPMNTRGGRWCISGMAASEFFPFYTELVLACISGLFQQHLEAHEAMEQKEGKEVTPDEILGVQLKRGKKSWGIDVWNKEAQRGNVRTIDLYIRSLLRVEERQNFSIEYKSHSGQIVIISKSPGEASDLSL